MKIKIPTSSTKSKEKNEMANIESVKKWKMITIFGATFFLAVILITILGFTIENHVSMKNLRVELARLSKKSDWIKGRFIASKGIFFDKSNR